MEMLNSRVDIIGRERRAISPTDQLSESPLCAQHRVLYNKGVLHQSEVLSLPQGLGRLRQL